MTESTSASAIKPDSLALRNVREDLGEALLAKYVEAKKIALANVDDVVKLNPATEIYVSILRAIPENKTSSAGYGEVLLAYGQVLLSFARDSVAQVAILGGDVETAALEANLKESFRKNPPGVTKTAKTVDEITERAVSSAEQSKEEEKGVKEQEGDVKREDKSVKEKGKLENGLGKDKMDVEKEQPKSNGAAQAKPVDDEDMIKPAETNGVKQNGKDSTGNTKGEEAEGDIEEDLDDETLTWEQLEYARKVFEELGAPQRSRLAEVHESLGDLLLETDQMRAAAVEYAKAIDILSEAEETQIRIISLLQYQRYLALRRDEPADAVTALTESVKAFEEHVEDAKQGKIKGDGLKEPVEKLEEVLNQMKEELESFKSALPTDALKSELEKKSSEGDGTITVVQPRRKKKEDETVTVVQPRRRTRKVMEGDDESAGEEPTTKKARMECDKGLGSESVVSQEEGKKEENGQSSEEKK